MKILITYDGANSIENKINDLKHAGLPPEGEATVFTVVEALMPLLEANAELAAPMSGFDFVKVEREQVYKKKKQDQKKAKKKAELEVKRFQKAFPRWAVHAEAVVDSPHWAIIKKADEWNPDLIVMGAHGDSRLARFFLGSVTRSVLIHSEHSVRIVRSQRRSSKSPVRILIGFDGSLESQTAINAVAGRKWPKHTSVKLVNVFDDKMAWAIAFNHFPLPQTCAKKNLGEKEYIRQVMAPFTKKLQQAGLEVSEEIKAGTPWKVFRREAERWKADCIFMGARGLGAVDRLLIGSVSSAVAARAHCSVEIVRPMAKTKSPK